MPAKDINKFYSSVNYKYLSLVGDIDSENLVRYW